MLVLEHYKRKDSMKKTLKEAPKSTTSNDVKNTKKQAGGFKAGIIGIGMLFVIASIAYTTTVIWLGTEGYISKVLTAPQVIFSVIVLVKRFTK
jgi:hypothetical protein